MADENFLSSVKIGGNDYEIYAKSALSAGWVPASAVSGTIAESSISSVPASAITAVNESAISSVNQSAISGIGWSAISSLTAASVSDTTAGIWTPSSTREYVTDYVAGKISNVYKFQGSCNISELPSNPENGDVYDIKDYGTINPGTEHEDTVTKGDNVAWVAETTSGYWDKLANSVSVTGILDTSAFTAWSANSNNDSVFSGTAKNAEVASTATNIGDSTHSAAGSDVIQSAWSGAAASAWVNTFTTDGIDTSYLSGIGTTNSKLGLKTPESSIDANTDPSAMVNAGGISSYVDSNYVAKSDITVDTSTHQLVIDNT